MRACARAPLPNPIKAPCSFDRSSAVAAGITQCHGPPCSYGSGVDVRSRRTLFESRGCPHFWARGEAEKLFLYTASVWAQVQIETTYSLHCSSFLGLPFRILNLKWVRPKKGTTIETIGMIETGTRSARARANPWSGADSCKGTSRRRTT